MNFESYQKEARKTAIYPDSQKVVYPALGLAGEAGEVCGKISKIYRDDSGLITEEKKEKIQSEIGDVLWFLAILAQDLGIDLEVAARMNLAKLDKRASENKISGDGDNR